MRFVFAFIMLTISLKAIAQDSIRYDYNFEFYDGLYLSFDDFRNDNPIDFARIISLRKVEDPMFLDDLLSSTTFSYRDRFGELRELTTNRIWGFARQGKPFMVLNAQSYMGIVSSRQYQNGSKNNYGRFVQLGQISLIQVNMQVSSPAQDYRQTGQFLFSMETGKAVHYTLAHFEELLKVDQELHAEFMKINSTRKKKQMFFSYLQRFNEKHPTYFPVFWE